MNDITDMVILYISLIVLTFLVGLSIYIFCTLYNLVKRMRSRNGKLKTETIRCDPMDGEDSGVSKDI